MARDTFQIRFDKHGHIVVDEPELARRLVYLLVTEGKLTVELDVDPPHLEPDAVLPNALRCLTPIPEPVPGLRPVPRNFGDGCLMTMCECTVDIIDSRRFSRQFDGIRGESGLPSDH